MACRHSRDLPLVYPEPFSPEDFRIEELVEGSVPFDVSQANVACGYYTRPFPKMQISH